MQKSQSVEAKVQAGNEQTDTKEDNILLDALDTKLAIFLIENLAATDQELADKLGVSRQTVNRRKNSKAVRGAIHNALHRSQGGNHRRISIRENKD